MASTPDFGGHGVADPADPLSKLRKQAFDKAGNSERGNSDIHTPDQAQLLLEDLRIHQIELELQNEELVRVQADLELSRSRYFDLYNLAPVGYLTIASDGAIIEANLRAAGLLGSTRFSLLRQRFTRFISVESQNTYREACRQVLQTGKPQICELKMGRPKGTFFWARLELILAEESEVQVYRAVVVDIGERKRLEESLREANAQLTLEKTIAEEATLAKSQFLSAMTHEIRTPLNGVVGMSGLLMQTALSPEQRSYARIVADSAEALLGLVNNVLDVAKIEAGRLELDETPFDLEQLIEDVLDMMSFKAHEKSLELACRYPAEAPRHFIADAGRVRQVLMNFISNAIKFTQEGYVLVEVECSRATNTGCNVRLAVHDTGIGISRQNLGHLFTPFAQADSTIARRYGGTGLGLSIVKEIVELMGGELGVSSIEGKGSSFSCKIPLKIEPFQPTLRSLQLAGLSVLVSGSLKISRIVIAEWCQYWGLNVEQCDLENLPNYMVTAAHDGRRFDMVIVDAGIEALLKALSNFPSYAGDTPPKLITLTSDPLEQASQLAADAVLSMPVRAKTLWEKICELAPAASTQLLSNGTPNISKLEKSQALRKFRVLVTDDNLVNQKLTSTLLARLGCEVDIACDGADAVGKVSQTEYGLVLMDCIMPVMDGFAASIAIRALAGKCGNVPIVALTASATEEDRRRCLAAGMNDFLTKPVRSEQLASCLAKWFKK